MKGPGTSGRSGNSEASNAHYLAPSLIAAIGLSCLALAIALYLIGKSFHRTQSRADELTGRYGAQICEPLSQRAAHTAPDSGESESTTERIGEPPVINGAINDAINAAEPPSPALDGMAWIPGGDFLRRGREPASPH